MSTNWNDKNGQRPSNQRTPIGARPFSGTPKYHWNTKGESISPIVGGGVTNLTSVPIDSNGYNIVDPDNPGAVLNFPAGTGSFNLLSKQSVVPPPYNGFVVDDGFNPPFFQYNAGARGQALWIKFATPWIVNIPSNHVQWDTGNHVTISGMIAHFFDVQCKFTIFNNGDQFLESNVYGDCNLALDVVLYDYDPTTLCFNNMPPLDGYGGHTSDGSLDPYQKGGGGGAGNPATCCVMNQNGLAVGSISNDNLGPNADNRDTWIPVPDLPQPNAIFPFGPQGTTFFQAGITARAPKTAAEEAQNWIGQEIAFPFAPPGVAGTRGYTITALGPQGDTTQTTCQYTVEYSPATVTPVINPNYITRVNRSYPVYGIVLTVNSSGSGEFGVTPINAATQYGSVQATVTNLDYVHGGTPAKEAVEIFGIGDTP